jgi:hypothetical protein
LKAGPGPGQLRARPGQVRPECGQVPKKILREINPARPGQAQVRSDVMSRSLRAGDPNREVIRAWSGLRLK